MRLVSYFCASLSFWLAGLAGLWVVGGWVIGWVVNLVRPALQMIPRLAVYHAHDHNMRPVLYFCASLSFWLAGLWVGCGWVAGWVVCKFDQHCSDDTKVLRVTEHMTTI